MTFNFRPPDDLWQQLRAAAKENGRSINSEIIQRLRQTFQGWKQ